MKALFVPVADGHYELKAMALDPECNTVLDFAVFHGANTVDGTVPVTGKTVAGEYVYSMEFRGDKAGHVSKVWNDAHALSSLAGGSVLTSAFLPFNLTEVTVGQ
ncbi:hypothetical protein AB833_13655 [Chromatiales bacterium (ex Bugula neritina AB1)]|nr:hypothetical protein AB833_13655 [Chromatiales bacterium (ex Bugula neritina AB1)]